jgi:hypothetical protein
MWCQLAVSRATDPKTLELARANLENALAQLSDDDKRAVERLVKMFRPQAITDPDPLAQGWQKHSNYQPQDTPFNPATSIRNKGGLL